MSILTPVQQETVKIPAVTRVINVRDTAAMCFAAMEGNYVYVGRPTKYGNRWTHIPSVAAKNPDLILVGSVQEAVENYYLWLDGSVEATDLRADIMRNLPGKTLGCFCAKKGGVTHADRPWRCHAQAIAYFADGYQWVVSQMASAASR